MEFNLQTVSLKMKTLVQLTTDNSNLQAKSKLKEFELSGVCRKNFDRK